MMYPINKATCEGCRYSHYVHITSNHPDYVGVEEEYYTCKGTFCPKRTCWGCKYYRTCGDFEREEPCQGYE